MVDLLANFARGDVSALVALLLVALFLVLRSIGKDLIDRLAKAEKALKRLGGFRQNHATRLVVIEKHIGVEGVEYVPEEDDE